MRGCAPARGVQLRAGRAGLQAGRGARAELRGEAAADFLQLCGRGAALYGAAAFVSSFVIFFLSRGLLRDNADGLDEVVKMGLKIIEPVVMGGESCWLAALAF